MCRTRRASCSIRSSSLSKFNATLGDPPDPRIHSFFRWHVVVGLILPVVSAGIFVACDTGSKVAYIDALFSG